MYLIIVAAAYLIGSLPSGYLAGKSKGIDIRTVGSGNIGATNTFRVLGKKLGAFVLLVDLLKGYCACGLLAPMLALWIPEAQSQRDYLELAAGVGAILGHNFTCWLKFRGGKGIATTAGVMIALSPGAALVVIVVWLLVFAIGRYVSVASIAGALSLPVAGWFFHVSAAKIWVFAGLGLMAILKHKSNIQRLINGTENRFGAPKKK